MAGPAAILTAMELFAVALLFLGSAIAAVARVRHDLRAPQVTAGGLVWRTVNDRVVWAGLPIGVGLAVSGMVGDALPAPWGWAWASADWVTSSSETGQAPTTGETVVAVAVTASLLAVPYLCVRVLPACSLGVGLACEVRRRSGKRGGPLRTIAVVTVAGLVIAMPLIMAMGYGLAIALVGMTVRRGRPARTPAGHPEMFETVAVSDALPVLAPGRSEASEELNQLLTKSWSELPALARYQVTRVAAVHLLVVLSIVGTGSPSRSSPSCSKHDGV